MINVMAAEYFNAGRVLSIGSRFHLFRRLKQHLQKQVETLTVKPVLSGHSKIDKTKVLMPNGSLMKVKSVAECKGEHSAVLLTCIIPLFHTGPESHELTRIDNCLDSWLNRTQFVMVLTDSHSP